MPRPRFFHEMGLASIIGGVVLIGIGQIVERFRRAR